MGDTTRDELDIQRVLADYAWGCDEGDWALLRSLFTDDAHLDYTTAGGPAGGADEVVGWLESSLTTIPMIHHVVSNLQIDLDGDHADVRAVFHCTAQLPGADGLLVTGGYYDDELVRTSEGWRIRRKREVSRFMQA